MTPRPTDSENWGSKRKGSGRPSIYKNESLTHVGVQLPVSLVKKMDKLGTRTEVIYYALKKYLE